MHDRRTAGDRPAHRGRRLLRLVVVPVVDRHSSTSGWHHAGVLLVTGGTGFLGSVLVNRLVQAGREVRVGVRDLAAARRILPSAATPVVAEITDVEALTEAARGCTAVLHLAASVGACPVETWQTNVEGTRAALTAALRVGARFVHTSSSAAVVDATGLLAEQPLGEPALTDPYSVSKVAAERLVLAAVADGLPAVIVNPVGIYGPSPRGPLSYNALLLAAARGEIAAVVDATIGWVLARDVADGLVLALERGEPGRRYVLCGEVASFGRVLHAFADRVGGRRVRLLPPGSTLEVDASGPAAAFAQRSAVYGSLAPVRVADAGARAIGFRPSGVLDGVARTAAWIGPRCADTSWADTGTDSGAGDPEGPPAPVGSA